MPDLQEMQLNNPDQQVSFNVAEENQNEATMMQITAYQLYLMVNVNQSVVPFYCRSKKPCLTMSG